MSTQHPIVEKAGFDVFVDESSYRLTLMVFNSQGDHVLSIPLSTAELEAMGDRCKTIASYYPEDG